MKFLPSTLAFLLFAGCATQTIPGDTASHIRNFVQNIEPGLRPASAAACSLTLSFAVKAQDQADVKKDLYVVASIVAAVTPDQTPGQLSKAIQAALPQTPEYKNLADAIAGGYAIALPYIKDDSALFLKVVSDIAAGCTEIAAAP